MNDIRRYLNILNENIVVENTSTIVNHVKFNSGPDIVFDVNHQFVSDTLDVVITRIEIPLAGYGVGYVGVYFRDEDHEQLLEDDSLKNSPRLAAKMSGIVGSLVGQEIRLSSNSREFWTALSNDEDIGVRYVLYHPHGLAHELLRQVAGEFNTNSDLKRKAIADLIKLAKILPRDAHALAARYIKYGATVPEIIQIHKTLQKVLEHD